jgi:hypothetical protein
VSLCVFRAASSNVDSTWLSSFRPEVRQVKLGRAAYLPTVASTAARQGAGAQRIGEDRQLLGRQAPWEHPDSPGESHKIAFRSTGTERRRLARNLTEARLGSVVSSSCLVTSKSRYMRRKASLACLAWRKLKGLQAPDVDGDPARRQPMSRPLPRPRRTMEYIPCRRRAALASTRQSLAIEILLGKSSPPIVRVLGRRQVLLIFFLGWRSESCRPWCHGARC